MEQDNSKNKIHLIEIFGFVAIVLLGISVYFFAKSPGRQTEFVAQNSGQEQINREQTEAEKIAEIPKEIFVAQEELKTIYGGEKVKATETEKLPSADKFKTFFYDPKIGKIIEVAGICSDFYYAIVVFKSTDDYKKNPATAKINNAFECPPARAFKANLNLAEFNLLAGEYYFFVADQGKTGTWYNPR